MCFSSVKYFNEMFEVANVTYQLWFYRLFSIFRFIFFVICVGFFLFFFFLISILVNVDANSFWGGGNVRTVSILTSSNVFR